MIKNLRGLFKFAIAAMIYAGFAVYIFWPHFKDFDALQYSLPVNVCLAALGCYTLSRRWVPAFASSFFAGAIYGFGPYMLGLLKFHPTAAFLATAIPWLFCPAAFVQKKRWHLLSMLLSILPFVIIILFFRAATHLRLFPIPTQAGIHLSDLAGLLTPPAMANQSTTLVGFYHVPLAALIMGLLMLFMARRLGVLIIFCLGIILTSCRPLLDVSPIIWLSIPVLCCSVLIGEGMQGLALAGEADRKWVLAIIVSMGILTIVTLLLATIPEFRVTIFDLRFMGHDLQLSISNQQSQLENVILRSAKLYILGTIAVGIIFFMARAKKRLLIVRWIVLCSAMAVDIFLGARYIIDRIL
jgi:hypothetical protein